MTLLCRSVKYRTARDMETDNGIESSRTGCMTDKELQDDQKQTV